MSRARDSAVEWAREQRPFGRTEEQKPGTIGKEQGAGSREQGAGSREQGAGSGERGAGSREQGPSGWSRPCSRMGQPLGFESALGLAEDRPAVGVQQDVLGLEVTVHDV